MKPTRADKRWINANAHKWVKPKKKIVIQHAREPLFDIDRMDEINAERQLIAQKITQGSRHCSRCKEPVVFARGERCGSCGFRM